MMKLSGRDLKSIIKEALGASQKYLRKERIREEIQQRIIDAIRKGEIHDNDSLVDYFNTIEIAVKALKMIPYDVFNKLQISKT